MNITRAYKTEVDLNDKQTNSNLMTAGADVPKAIRELGNAARSLRVLSDYLEEHPEALLRGKAGAMR